MEWIRLQKLPISRRYRIPLRFFSSRYPTPLRNSRKYQQETLQAAGKDQKLTVVPFEALAFTPKSESINNGPVENVRPIDWIRAARQPSEVVPKLEEIIGYQFENAEIGWQALQANLKDGLVPAETERLAFLGGNVLRWKVIERWYPMGTGVAVCHGELIKYCSKGAGSSERNTGTLGTLATVGIENGILELMNWNLDYFRGGPISGWRLNAAIAYAMHAVIGAIFADGGVTTIPAVIERLGLLKDVSADAAMPTGRMQTYMNIKMTLKRLPPPNHKLDDKFMRNQKKRVVKTKVPTKQPKNIDTELRKAEPQSLFFGSSL